MKRYRGRNASRAILTLALVFCLLLASAQVVEALAALHPQDPNRLQIAAERVEQALLQQTSHGDAVVQAEYLTLTDPHLQETYQAAASGTYLVEAVILPDGRQGVLRVNPLDGQLTALFWNNNQSAQSLSLEFLDREGNLLQTTRVRQRRQTPVLGDSSATQIPPLEEEPVSGQAATQQAIDLAPGQLVELRMALQKAETPVSGEDTSENSASSVPAPIAGGLGLQLYFDGEPGPEDLALTLERSRDNQSWESHTLSFSGGQRTLSLEEPESGYTYRLRADKLLERDGVQWELAAIGLDSAPSAGVSGRYSPEEGAYLYARITGADALSGTITVTYRAPEGNPEQADKEESPEGTGALTITASVSDGGDVATVYKITDAKGNTTFATIKGTGSVTIVDMPEGVCRVEEVPFATTYRASEAQTCTTTPQGGTVHFTVYRVETGYQNALDDNL